MSITLLLLSTTLAAGTWTSALLSLGGPLPVVELGGSFLELRGVRDVAQCAPEGGTCVALPTCIVRLPEARTVAGDCAWAGALDGPPHFARFTDIQRMASAGSVLAVLDAQGIRLLTPSGGVTTLSLEDTAVDIAVSLGQVAVATLQVGGGGCFTVLPGDRYCNPQAQPTSVASDGQGGWFVAWKGGLLQHHSLSTTDLTTLEPQVHVVKLLGVPGGVLLADGVGELMRFVSFGCAACQPGFTAQAGTCAMAPPGSFALDGKLVQCAKGTYNPLAGTGSPQACKPCPPGTYAASEGHIMCVACNETHRWQTADRTGCATLECASKQCKPTQQVDPNTCDCINCPPGTTSDGGTNCYIQCTASCPVAPLFQTCSETHARPVQPLFALQAEDMGATCLLASPRGNEVYVGGPGGLARYQKQEQAWVRTSVGREEVLSMAWYTNSSLVLLTGAGGLVAPTLRSIQQPRADTKAIALTSCARQQLFLVDTVWGLWRLTEGGWVLWHAQQGLTAAVCQASRLVFVAQQGRGVWEVDAWYANTTAKVLFAPTDRLLITGGIAIWANLPTLAVQNSLLQLSNGSAQQLQQWPYALTTDEGGTQLLFRQRGSSTVSMAVTGQVIACLCAQDWYQEPGGACLPCAAGTHAEAGATVCTPCAAGLTSTNKGCVACSDGMAGCGRALEQQEPEEERVDWFTPADVTAMRGQPDFLCVSQVAVAPCRPLPFSTAAESLADWTPGMWWPSTCDARPQGQWRLAWEVGWAVWTPGGSLWRNSSLTTTTSKCAVGQPAAAKLGPVCVYEGGRACTANELPLSTVQTCKETTVCVAYRSIAGQRAVFGYTEEVLQLAYVPCLQRIPLWAEFVQGPDPASCYFGCQYGVLSAEVPAYYAAQAIQTQALTTSNNTFEVLVDATDVCQACGIQTLCPVGTWRPPYNGRVSTCGSPCFLRPELCLPGVGDCIGTCVKPQESTFVSGGSNTAQSCAWRCNPGYFAHNGQCVACTADACQPGERFIGASVCTSSLSRAQVCIPCPTFPPPNLLVLRQAATTTCEYTCTDSMYYVPTPLPYAVLQGTPPCLSCALQAGQSCPAGYRVSETCQSEMCVKCSPVPAEVVPMPSANTTCMGMCARNYVDPKTNATAPAASLRCARCTTCDVTVSFPCAAGQYLLGAQCTACPSHTTCATGWYRAPCTGAAEAPPCVRCAPLPADSNRMYVPYTAQQADACPAVCITNTAWKPLLQKCQACSLLNSMGLTYFAVWNATPGVRWWPSSMDPPVSILPLRSNTDTVEPRAGRCWPCPSGTVTLMGAADLCLSSVYAMVATVQSQGVTRFKGGRALLQHKHACGAPYASPITCECPSGAYLRRCLTPSAVSPWV